MSKSISTQGSKTPVAPPLPKSKRGGRSFWKEVNREIRKVSWPSRIETNRLTGIVLAICGIIVIILFAESKVADIFVQLTTTGKVK